MKKIIRSRLIVLLWLALLFTVCDRSPFHPKKSSQPVENKSPETFLFLFFVPDTVVDQDTTITELATTTSKQVLHWWGDDSDGEVVGYYIQWSYDAEPYYTTAEHDTFYVPIRTRFDQFTFSVWAVDNEGAQDPTPAVQTFPVSNKKPEIEFKTRSNPPVPTNNPNVTSYTFPTRTFFWDVYDPDGVETVKNILCALDDTSNWQELPGNIKNITLTELSPGEHRFFVKAVDIAGAVSNTISFPDPDDNDIPNRWVVKEPLGDVLLVNDFAQDQTNYEVQTYYKQILNNIVGAQGYSVWEIGTSSIPVINPQNSLPYATTDIKANLGYFKKVIWFSHLGRPNITEAGLSITQYMADGGKIFITNANEEIPDTSWTFTDIDSVYRLNPGGRLMSGVNIFSSLTNTERDSLFDLKIEKLIGNRVSALVPGSGADVVYRMESDTTAAVKVPYTGTPAVGVRYRVGSGESIYFSLPFHFCNGNGNLEDIIRYILLEEFEQ